LHALRIYGQWRSARVSDLKLTHRGKVPIATGISADSAANQRGNAVSVGPSLRSSGPGSSKLSGKRGFGCENIRFWTIQGHLQLRLLSVRLNFRPDFAKITMISLKGPVKVAIACKVDALRVDIVW